MFSRVRVRDFQSLADVDIDLGRFTVVIGASNSGKSALLRAIRALCLNVASPPVRHGAKRLRVGASFDSGDALTLERGKAFSEYELDGKKYPKSGKDVPVDVERFLRVSPESFAFQFDRPFLLDEPATKVAQTLGDLTNVTVVYDAVREANRRRLETERKLVVRRGDVAALEVKAAAFKDLPETKRKLHSLNIALGEADERQRARDRLAVQLHVVKVAMMVLDSIEVMPPLPDIDVVDLDRRLLNLLQVRDVVAQASVTIVDLPPLPDIDVVDLDRRHRERLDMRDIVTCLLRASSDITLATRDIDALDNRVRQLDEVFHVKLSEAGTCPLCGQTTEGVKVGI